MSASAAEIAEEYYWEPTACPICRKPPTKKLGRRGGTAHRQKLGVECEIWCCQRCDLVFPNPMPFPVKGIEQHYALEPDAYFEHHDSNEKEEAAFLLLQSAEELVGRKGVLLDIGAGRGEILCVARKLGWRIYGIEPSKQFAQYAAKSSGAEILSEPIEKCAFEDNSFDVIILGAVLEHLYNPDETIAEISRVLRRGGALFVDVPNERGLYFLIGNIYQRLRNRDWVVNLAPTFSPFHVFGFTPRSLRLLLHKHGLKPVRWKIYGGKAMVPYHGGVVGILERQAANVITLLSNIGSLGTYIETWAIKR